MSNKEEFIIAGRRLKECMDIQKIGFSELSRRVSEIEGTNVIKQRIYSYTKGEPMSERRKHIFADVLGIDVGYLIGTDGFTASTYEMYQEIASTMNTLSMNNDDFKLYKQFFGACGLSLISPIEGEQVSFVLNNDANIGKEFGLEDMKRFFNIIVNQVNDLFADYIEKDVSPSDFEECVRFARWHGLDALKEYISDEEIEIVRKEIEQKGNSHKAQKRSSKPKK